MNFVTDTAEVEAPSQFAAAQASHLTCSLPASEAKSSWETCNFSLSVSLLQAGRSATALKPACLAMDRRAEAGLPAAGARGAETLPGRWSLAGFLADDGVFKFSLAAHLANVSCGRCLGGRGPFREYPSTSQDMNCASCRWHPMAMRCIKQSQAFNSQPVCARGIYRIGFAQTVWWKHCRNHVAPACAVASSGPGGLEP